MATKKRIYELSNEAPTVDHYLMGDKSGNPAGVCFTIGDIEDLFSNDFEIGSFSPPTTAFDFNSQRVFNVASPTLGGDAANKDYVDLYVQGMKQKPTAQYATAAALPACTYSNGSSGVGATLTGNANGALSVDGVAVTGSRLVLVKDQASAAQNGLYFITQTGNAGAPFILTRDISMDVATEFRGAFIPVSASGVTNANSLWLCSLTSDPTVGTTAINFTQLNKGTDLSAGNGISISGNTVALANGKTGSFGVGTTSPGGILEVKGGFGSQGQVIVTDTSATGTSSFHMLAFNDSAGTRQGAFYKEAGGNLNFINDQNGHIKFVINGGTRLDVDASNSTFTNNCIPSATNTYDLGSSSAKWNNGYITNLYIGPAGAKAGGTVKDFVADAGNSTTTETDIFSYTIPANTLATNNDKFSAFFSVNNTGSGTATSQFKVYFAGTARFDSGALALSVTGNCQFWVEGVRVSSSTARITISAQIPNSPLTVYTAEEDMTSLDFTTTNILKLTGQRAGVGAASNDILGKHGWVRIDPAA